jgi:hypothetical protein
MIRRFITFLIQFCTPLKRFHNFLEKYKVIFEVFSLTIIGTASVVVAFFQWRVAREQTILTKLQTDLARVQAIPQFIVENHLKFNEESRVYEEEEITVVNSGGFARNLQEDCFVFLNIQLFSPKFGQTNFSLPINGYFTASFVTSTSGVGQLIKSVGYKNNLKAVDLEREFRALGSRNGVSCLVSFKKYLGIRYLDLLGEQHNDFFSVSSVFGGSLIETEQGNQLLKEHKNGFATGSFLEFNNINSTNIFNELLAKLGVKKINE